MNSTITMTPPSAERITLYYREGASDKVYQAALEPQGEGFVVHFAFGRRGATLNTGTKTASPVDYEAAKRIYDKLVREKTAKGYTPGEDGTPYQHTQKEGRASGILPQLLNPVDDTQLEALLNDTLHGAQEKFDGRRVLLVKQNGALHGINRKGLLIGLPEPVFQAARAIPGDFILDGECVGEVLHAFDLLEWDGQNFRIWPYEERLASLAHLLSNHKQPHLVPVTTCWTPTEKRTLLKALQAAQKEGIVFKNLDAPYTPGRPASGGAQLKYKFYATASAVVNKLNAQRSVEVRLFNGHSWQVAGNVTIPANHPVPPVGAVVELRYLYAFRESGVLYQPTYLGVREDLRPEDCRTGQLKYKADTGEEES